MTQAKPDIRWLIRRDMPEVLKTELYNAAKPWSEEDFLTALRNRNCIGMVAEIELDVAGFMIYELHKDRLHLLRFCVHPDWRGEGIGSAMIGRLAEKLSTQRRHEIVAEVGERNLGGQLFLQKCGFRCIKVIRDPDEASYVMQYRVRSTAEGREDYARVAKF